MLEEPEKNDTALLDCGPPTEFKMRLAERLKESELEMELNSVESVP